MNLDLCLTQLALKMKHLVVVDVSFPSRAFPEFKKAYDTRYVHLPLRGEMLRAYVTGLASQGMTVLVYGHKGCPEFLDTSLSIKWLTEDWKGNIEGLKVLLQSYGAQCVPISS
jgi:hypothetical protein